MKNLRKDLCNLPARRERGRRRESVSKTNPQHCRECCWRRNRGQWAGGGSAYIQNMQRVAVNDIIETNRGKGGNSSGTDSYLKCFTVYRLIYRVIVCILWLHAHAACMHSNWIKRAQVVARVKEREREHTQRAPASPIRAALSRSRTPLQILHLQCKHKTQKQTQTKAQTHTQRAAMQNSLSPSLNLFWPQQKLSN